MRSLLVAGGGGHLEELYVLRPRLAGLADEVTWVTQDTAQSRSLLSGERCLFVPGTEPRSLKAAVSYARVARRILAEPGWSSVVSTGALMAVPFLAVARTHGIESHFIESAARVELPSLSGRLLERVPGVHRYCQYQEGYAGRSRSKWIFAGSVFDSFATGEQLEGPVRRVVVTLGTSTFSFRRLLERALEVLPSDVEVVWQTGATAVSELPVEAQAFMPAAELFSAMEQADLVIAHAGAGSAINAMRAGHQPVLVPRRRNHLEHVDDHQGQIAAQLGRRGLASVVGVEEITWDRLVSNRRRVGWRDSPPPLSLTGRTTSRTGRTRAVSESPIPPVRETPGRIQSRATS